MIKGRCECGSVHFEVPTVRETVTVCHCSQCRRMSGHMWASTHAQFDDVIFTKHDGLTWYQSSDWAKRGFCNKCGSSLFYRLNTADWVSIAAGCLENAGHLTIGKHIFVKDKGAYYSIPAEEPQIEKF